MRHLKRERGKAERIEWWKEGNQQTRRGDNRYTPRQEGMPLLST